MRNLQIGRSSLIAITLLFLFSRLLAQEISGTTDNGRRIILKSNGTWWYNEKDTAKRLTYVELETKLAAATRQLQALEEAAYTQLCKAVAMAGSYKSLEQNDPELKGLVALQASIFNTRCGGSSTSETISNGLRMALISFGNPPADPNSIPKMAAEIRRLVTRNMTKMEWEQFFGALPYEQTCVK